MAVLFCSICFGQSNKIPYSDTMPLPTFGYNQVYHDVYVSSGEWCNYYSQNDSIVLHGDTLKLFKLIFSEYKKKDSIINVLTNTIYKGVMWSNVVPDYYRSGKHDCSWVDYFYLLKQIGYDYVPNPTPAKLKPCKK